MENIITDEIKLLGKAFTDNNFQLRIVGGAVRDALLGKNPKDIDFCTDATPDEMIAFLSKAGWSTIPTGIEHGTISVLCSLDEPFEITTLRVDTETDGRRATVDFTRDFKVDAERRDLTINAMSMDLDGVIFDYFGGQDDLENGIVRFVGDAEKRIQEDFLRIMRFFRFMGRFSATADINTLNTIDNNSTGLDSISGERIWSELQKIITGPNAEDTILLMVTTGAMPKELNGSFKVVDSTNPVTLLSTMVSLPSVVNERFKFSTKEMNLLTFLHQNRFSNFSVQKAKEMVALEKDVKLEFVVELFKRLGENDKADELSDWVLPTFPVTGKDLLADGVAPGPKMGEMLNTLKRNWVASNFTLTKETLLR